MISLHAQIGSAVMMVGGIFAFLGFAIFDNGLLALGNLFLVSGSFTMLGFQKSRSIVLQRENIKFSLCSLLGLGVVLSGRPRIGIIIEIFGSQTQKMHPLLLLTNIKLAPSIRYVLFAEKIHADAIYVAQIVPGFLWRWIGIQVVVRLKRCNCAAEAKKYCALGQVLG
jgi:hypothetical protein